MFFVYQQFMLFIAVTYLMLCLQCIVMLEKSLYCKVDGLFIFGLILISRRMGIISKTRSLAINYTVV